MQYDPELRPSFHDYARSLLKGAEQSIWYSLGSSGLFSLASYIKNSPDALALWTTTFAVQVAMNVFATIAPRPYMVQKAWVAAGAALTVVGVPLGIMGVAYANKPVIHVSAEDCGSKASREAIEYLSASGARIVCHKMASSAYTPAS